MRSREMLISVGIVVAFAVPRLILAAVREPFFDELFTLWVTRLPLDQMLEAVRIDSGPPLYYILVHLLGIETIAGLRALSMFFALSTCGLVLSWTSLGSRRITAAALLAAFPPQVYFSGEGRAYAMAGFGVAAGVLAAHEWAETSQRRWLIVSCVALLLGAYSHYYGVLFFATPLLVAPLRRAIPAVGVTVIAFIPGIMLALSQPREAMAWISEMPVLLPLQHLAFAARYPDVFLPPVPVLLHLSALLLTLVIAWSGRRDRLALRFAVITLVPIVAAIALGLIGFTVYFPVRFESVLAVPFILWMACALEFRRVLAPLCILLGVFVCAHAATVHYHRGPDPVRRGALFIAARVDPSVPVVASGYAYLEAIAAGRNVQAFPSEQASHPGWRAPASPERLGLDVQTLPRSFVWIGEAGSLEESVLGARYRLMPLFVEGGIVVARATPRSL
jgi:hypothetical protein